VTELAFMQRLIPITVIFVFEAKILVLKWTLLCHSVVGVQFLLE